MVELVDTRDLKSRGLGRVRAGSSPAPGTKLLISVPFSLFALRCLRLVCATVPMIVPKLCPDALTFICSSHRYDIRCLFLALGMLPSPARRFSKVIFVHDVVAVKEAAGFMAA